MSREDDLKTLRDPNANATQIREAAERLFDAAQPKEGSPADKAAGQLMDALDVQNRQAPGVGLAADVLHTAATGFADALEGAEE